MLNLSLNINNTKIIMRFSHTVTATEITTNTIVPAETTTSTNINVAPVEQPISNNITERGSIIDIDEMISQIRTRRNQNNNVTHENFNGNENTSQIVQNIPDNAQQANVPNLIEQTQRININEVCSEIDSRVEKIGMAMDATINFLEEEIKKKEIILERTIEATERSRNILKRTEQFLRGQPGRAAFYFGGGLALAWTLYNVFKYRQLPFSLYTVASKLIGSASNIAPSMTPVEINVTYPPMPVIPNMHNQITNNLPISETTGYIFGGILTGIIFALKFLKK